MTVPVCREARDHVADDIASFMRGEITRRVLFTRLDEQADRATKSDVTDRYLLGFLEWWRWNIGRSLSHSAWNELARELTFLKSDLEERTFPAVHHRLPDLDREVMVTRCLAACLAIAAGVSLVVGWWLAISAWIMSFVAFHIWSWRSERSCRASGLEVRHGYFPFADRDDWQAHESLVDAFRLPPYENSVHARREGVRRWQEVAMAGAWWILGGTMVAVAFAGSIAMWPLWLIAMSLSWKVRDGTSES